MSTNEKHSEKAAMEEIETHHRREHNGHGHHHRRKKKKKPLKERLPKFMRKKKFWVNISILLGTLVLLTTAGLIFDMQQHNDVVETEKVEKKENVSKGNGSITVTVPFYEDPVLLVGGAVQSCMKADVDLRFENVLRSYKEEGIRLDKGLPVKLSYEISGLPTTCSVRGAVVEVCEDTSFTASRMFFLKEKTRSVDVYHLKTGTQYYYRITIELTNGTSSVVQGSFVTADTPRILSIDGAVNVRDIGGWKTTDGRKIRQGLLYRGSELDGAVEAEYKITAKGLQDMLSVLAIRTDLDLRVPQENLYGQDALGAGVEHIQYSLPEYDLIFTSYGEQAVRTLFAKLADESTYPAYLHCAYGRDRTGTVCYLLKALLGVGEEDLMRDYLLSSLYHTEMMYDRMDKLVVTLNTYPGETMQEKVQDYLLSIGVTRDEIKAIKQIFLE